MTVTHGNDSIVANTEVVLKLRLRIEPPGEPSFEIHQRFRFSQFSLPSEGAKLAVIFDPDDHEDVILDPSPVATVNAVAGPDLGAIFAGVQQARAQAGGDPHALAELIRQQFTNATVIEGAGAVAVNPVAPAKPEDPIDLLEKLSDLRDKGVLTPEEFEAQKKRILG